MTDTVVDFSKRYYFGSAFEEKISASIANTFKRPIASGILLELWYKDTNKIKYVSENLSNYSGIDEIFSKLGEKIEIPEKIEKKPRSYSFYVHHHRIFFTFLLLATVLLVGFVSWSFMHKEDIRVLLIIPFLFFYYIFFKRFFSRT